MFRFCKSCYIKLIQFLDIFFYYFERLKFYIFNKGFTEISYYQTSPRYGQFLSGIYLFFIQNNYRTSVIFVYDVNHFKALKKIFLYENIFFTRNKLFFNFIRLNFNNQFSEKFILNFHENEVIPSNNNLKKIIIYNIQTSFFDELKSKFEGKKILLIALKEKTYYAKNEFFNNYLMPDFEFEEFDRLLDVVKYFCNLNYFVIRVGSKYIPTTFKDNNFMDYASSSFQNFENDVLIANSCDLVISNQTGFDILPNLWFKKPVIHFNIRSYRFILDWPGIYVCPMLIFKDENLLSIRTQMELEYKLWPFSSDPNNFYINYYKNGFTIKKRNSEEIVRIVNNFIREDNLFYDQMWSDWHLFNDNVYNFINREVPKFHYAKMIC
jgi:putative glycosyltransferase (TIGR04372 family)